MTLWFKNSQGVKRQIADCATWDDVCYCIHKFIEQCNENKPEKDKFESHYMRMWKEDGMVAIDVGSWSEFFYWEGEYPCFD